QEVQRLQKRTLVAAKLQRLAADISLRNEDIGRAVELAQEAVSAESRDYRDHLWLGQILAASGKMPREAEQRLRRALALADNVPETWVALVRFLGATDRGREAEALMAQARTRLPAAQLPLVLAECHEALGQMDQARAQYQAALKAQPENVLVLRSVAAHHLRANRFHAAEPQLRATRGGRVEASEADMDWARHHLALVLAAQGSYPKLLQALDLVGLKLDPSGDVSAKEPNADEPTVEEQLAQAHVLALQPHRKLRA